MAKSAAASAPKLTGNWSHTPTPRGNPSRGEIGEVGRPPKTSLKPKPMKK